MTDLDSYSNQIEGFRASDEARERLVSVRSCRVSEDYSLSLMLKDH
jgi:hypothetical protein